MENRSCSCKLTRVRPRCSARVLLRMQQRSIGRALSRWCEYSRTKVKMDQQLRKVVRVFQHKDLVAAFRQWLSSLEQRRFVGKLADRLWNRLSARAFDGWLSSIQEEIRVTGICGRVIRRLQHRVCSSAFGRWVEFGHQRRVAYSVMQKLANLRLRHAFSGWQEGISEMFRLDAVVGRVIRRMQHASCSSAFGRWHEFCHQRRVAYSVLQKINNMHLQHAFSTWLEQNSEMFRLAVIVDRVIRRMQHACCTKAFGQWYEFCHQRWVASTALRQLQNVYLQHAFSGWQEAISEMFRLAVVVGRIIRRMQHSSCSMAFSRWVEFCYQRRVASTVMKKLANMHLQHAFSGWLAGIEDMTRVAVVAGRVIRRMQHASCSMALRRWVEYREQRFHSRTQITKLLLRLQHGRVGRAFDSWKQSLVDLIRFASIVQRVVNRLQNRQVHAAFQSWTFAVELQQHNKKLVAKTLRRLQHMKLSSAFDGWQRSVVELVRCAGIVRRVLARLQQREMGQAFGRWDEYRQQLLVARRVMTKLSNLTLHQALHQWACAIELRHEEQDSKAEKQRRVEQTVRRLLQRWLAYAFDGWVSGVQEKVRVAGVCGRVIRRLQNLSCSSAFGRWDEYRQQLLVARRVMKKMLLFHLVRVLRVWYYFARSERLARADEEFFASQEEVDALQERVAIATEQTRLANEAASLAKEECRRYVARFAELENARNGALKLLTKLKRRISFHLQRRITVQLLKHMLVVWSGWATIQLERSERDLALQIGQAKDTRVVSIALQRMRQQSVTRCFAWWRTHAQMAANRSSKLGRAVAKMRNLAAASAFAGWSVHVRTIRRQLWLTARVVARIQQQLIGRAWARWRQFRRQRCVARRAIGRLERSRLAAALHRWRATATRRRGTDTQMAALAVGETAILMTPLFIPIEHPKKRYRGVPSNDSLADGAGGAREVLGALVVAERATAAAGALHPLFSTRLE